jgi:hypothetical protein
VPFILVREYTGSIQTWRYFPVIYPRCFGMSRNANQPKAIVSGECRSIFNTQEKSSPLHRHNVKNPGMGHREYC